MAESVNVEIVRDRCTRCGEGREAVFDFVRNKNTATIPARCPNSDRCAQEMGTLYLVDAPKASSAARWGFPETADPREYGWHGYHRTGGRS